MIPSWLAVQALKLSGGRAGLLVIILATLAGIISLFVDNVVVILMMAPVALPLARALKIPVTPLILMITFGAMYVYGFRSHRRRTEVDIDNLGVEARIPNPLFATIVVAWFLMTVLGMAFRQVLGVQLGFFAMTGAISLVLLLELRGERTNAPDFEEVLTELDWRAVFFYIALFALVGSLEKVHILEMLADRFRPLFEQSYMLGASLLYWVTVPIVGIVEHDAYILTFLHTIKHR